MKQLFHFRPDKEESLLILICRTILFPTNKHINELRIFLIRYKQKIRWWRVANLVRYNKLVRVFHLAVNAYSLEQFIPEDQILNSRVQYFIVELHEKFHEAEMQKLLREFTAHEVHFTILRSYPRRASLFKQPLKTSTDMDILIDSDNILENYILAKRLLERMGYLHETNNSITLTENHKTKEYQAPYFQELFVKPLMVGSQQYQKICVEIHTSVVDYFSFPPHIMSFSNLQVLNRLMYLHSNSIIDGNIRYKALSLSDLFLCQCLHLIYQHNYGGISTYVEIALIIKTYQNRIDWDYVETTSKSLQVAPYIYALLHTLEELFPNLEVQPNILWGKMHRWFESRSSVKKVLLSILPKLAIHPIDYTKKKKYEALKIYTWSIIADLSMPEHVIYFLYAALYFALPYL